MLNVFKYSPERKSEWDCFVKESSKGRFLFYRDYLEYHADRYTENSLMIFDGTELIALLPANLNENKLCSHGYLTYGGFVVKGGMKTALMLKVFYALIEYCARNGIKEVVYKAIPFIYNPTPKEEDLYALFRNKAELLRREISSVIYVPEFHPPLNRRTGYRKALKNNVELRITDDYDSFMAIVNENLNSKYGKSAVHTAAELRLLSARFPENIKLYGAYKENILLAGAVIYQDNKIAHLQYLHSSAEGKNLRALDFIILSLLGGDYSEYTYFDFGHSTEEGGYFLNESLINLKEEYGASGVCYDTYSIEIKD